MDSLILEKDIGIPAEVFDMFPAVLLKNDEILNPIYAAEDLIPFPHFYRSRSHQWFDPADGLRTVHGCLRFLRQYPNYIKNLELWEYQRLERVYRREVRSILRRPSVRNSPTRSVMVMGLGSFHDPTSAFFAELHTMEQVLVAAQQHRIGFYFWSAYEVDSARNWSESDSIDPGHTVFAKVTEEEDEEDDGDESDSLTDLDDEEYDPFEEYEEDPLLPIPIDDDQ